MCAGSEFNRHTNYEFREKELKREKGGHHCSCSNYHSKPDKIEAFEWMFFGLVTYCACHATVYGV